MSDDCLRRNLNVLKLLADTRPDIVLFHALWVVSGPDELRPSIEALRSSGIEHIVILGPVPNWLPMPLLPITGAPAICYPNAPP